MKTKKEIKLAHYLAQNLGAVEGYERGEADIEWKNKDIYDYGLGENPHKLFQKMAKDIIEILEELCKN